jgi:hypothetical protein
MRGHQMLQLFLTCCSFVKLRFVIQGEIFSKVACRQFIDELHGTKAFNPADPRSTTRTRPIHILVKALFSSRWKRYCRQGQLVILFRGPKGQLQSFLACSKHALAVLLDLKK